MASPFNLTAQINLQGPTNLRPIISNIKKQINAANVKLNLDVSTASAKNITGITQRLNSLSKAAINANNNIANLNTTLSNLGGTFNNLGSALTSNVNAITKTNSTVAATSKTVAQTTTAMQEFGKQSGLAIKRFAAFSSVTTVIFSLSNAIHSAFNEFVSFNKEIVRLSQVTGKSASDLGDITKEITRLSTGLGVASSDLLNVATTLAQAGLSAEDTKVALEALAESALAPSFDNLTDTTEGAIAAFRQFGLQSTDLKSALGSINAVAATFAVESSDIITAIQRAGSAFSSSSRGVSEGKDALNEFIAVFTSVRATTRESAETIATGLRTIFTRIQRSKTIDLLKQYGVELRDLEGKFVGPYEATKRLAAGLNSLDPRSSQFAAIAEELGGFRQINKVIPLLQQFAVAEQALSVAQKGAGSTARDAQTAQQSLAVQFTKTRESFVALIREIGDSTSFKAFVGVSLTLTNGFINLARALKPLLPLLLTFASIKAGGAITEFASGFKIPFGGRGGGSLPGGGTGSPQGGGSGGGGGGSSSNITAINANTATLSSTSQILTTLNQSILALNQNIVNNNSLLLNKPTRGFASGGLVPGSGNRDTYKAMLTPGEFVIRKKAVETIGAENLAKLNQGGYAVQRYAVGGKSRKGMKLGARSRFTELTSEEMDQLTTPNLIKYGRRLARDIFSRGGAGIATSSKFIPVAPERITPELESSLVTYLGQKGFWEEQISPFAQPNKKIGVQKEKLSRETALKRQESRLADEVAARAQEWTKITSGSPIDNYLLSSLSDPILSDYKTVRGGGSLAKDFHNTRLRQAVNKALESFDDFDYSASNIDKFVSAFAAKKFANGGLVQKFEDGTEVKEIKTVAEILSDIFKDKFIPDPATNSGKIRTKPLVIKQGENKGQSQERYITAKDILSSKSLANLAKSTGLNLSDLTSAQETLKARSEGQKLASVAFKKQVFKNKQEAVSANKVIPFGLVGLRYGSGAQNQSSIGTFPVEVPPSFSDIGLQNIRGINIGSDESAKQQFIKIITSTVSSNIGQDYAQQFQDAVYKGFETSVINGAKVLASKSKLGTSINTNPSDIKKFIENAGFYNVIGAGLESSLNLLGAPFTPKDEDTKAIDFPTGLGPASAIFGSAFKDIPTDVTRTIGPGGKDATKYIEQIQRYFKTNEGLQTLARFANGGGVHSDDTVPALLTPGEFVINKSSAKRIGYGTLNRLNKADKIQGFNKGGAVGYAGGGLVDSIGGNAGGIAAIVSILLPEVQKLASSFANLQGETASYIAALGGATREASSLAISTGIALKAVGANQTTTNIAMAGATIAGGISGALTDGTGKALEKALLKNVEIFSKFDKNLQDITNAPTEELKLEAADRLEKTFNQLDRSVNQAKISIDFLEKAKRAGESLNNLTLSIVTAITTFNALNPIIKSATLAASSAGLGKMGGTMGKAAAAVSPMTMLLGTFGKFIPYVGLAITGFSLLAEGMKLFGTSLTKSSEQLDRLYKNLDDVTKNSKAFSLANNNFVNNTLKSFTQVKNANSGDRKGLLSSLGSIQTGDNINELNLTFRTLLKSKLATQGLTLANDQSIQNLRKGLSADSSLFKKALEEATKEFTQRQFLMAQQAGGVSPEVAQAEFDRLNANAGGRDIIKSVVDQYVGAKNLEILALKELALANNSVKINLANLDNVLVSLNARLQLSLENTIAKFDDLDNKIGVIGGQPQPTGGEFLRRNLPILDNLQAAGADEIKKVTKTVEGLLNIGGADSESQRLFKDLSSQVEAQRLLQQEFPMVLKEIASSPLGIGGIKDVVSNRLSGPLGNIVGQGNTDAINTLINEISSNLSESLNKSEAITSLDELARKNESVAALLKQGEPAIKAYKTAIENAAKVQDKTVEQSKKIIDIQNTLTQSLITRRKNELQSNIDLKRTLGQDVSLKELNSVFEAEIKGLTSNLGGNLPQQGTTNVTAIAAELKARKNSLKAINDEIQTKGFADNKLKQQQLNEINAINHLNTALNTFATSTEAAKNALEKIAEAQNLFKSQEETLLELIEGAKNPETAIQQQAIIQAIQAVESGRSTSDQRTLVAREGLRFVNATRSAEQAQIFRQKLLTQGVQDTSAGNISEAIAKGFALMFLGSRNKVGPQNEFDKANKNRNQAAIAAEKPLEEQISTITNETSSIFKNFNQNLSTIFPSVIDNLKRIESEINKDRTKGPQPSGFRASIPGDFSTRLRDSLDKMQEQILVDSIGFLAGTITPETRKSYSKEQTDTIMSTFANEGPSRAFEQTKQIMKQLSGKPFDMTKGSEEVRKLFFELEDYLKESERENTSPTSSGFPKRSRFDKPDKFPIFMDRPAPRNVPTPRDSGAIIEFNNTVGKLASVFETNTQPIQNLSESIGTFSTTATQLVTALKDFSNKFENGMKGQISYNGDVNLNFNDTLDVSLPTDPNKNRTLLSDIEPTLRNIIGNVVTNVIRKETS